MLGSVKYGDNKLIVDTFARNNGPTAFLLNPRSNSTTTRSLRNILQAGNILEVEYDRRPRTNIHTIKRARIAQPYTDLPFNPMKTPVVIFIGEVLRHTITHEPPSTTLYDWLEQSLLWLDNATTHYASFHLLFLLQLAKQLGVQPTTPLNTLTYDTLHLMPLTRQQRNDHTEQLLRHLADHVPAFGTIRSFEILKEMFA